MCITGFPITKSLSHFKEGDKSRDFLNEASGYNYERSMDLFKYGDDIEFHTHSETPVDLQPITKNIADALHPALLISSLACSISFASFANDTAR